MQNKFKILILNATSPRNTGDLAILVGLLSVVNKKNKLKIHSTEPNLYRNLIKNKVSHTLYSWSIFEKRDFISRVRNIGELFLNYSLLKYGHKNFRIGKSASILEDYLNTDLILFVGGGYLRSKKGIKQSLNLIMTLFHFQVAKQTKARKIVAPISFGPFAYKWQERYAANVLKDFDVVAVREEYSYKILKKYKMKNIILSSDHALMTKRTTKKITSHKLTLGFTIREWLKGDKHTNFEKVFAEAVQEFSELTGARVQPIVQVDASKYGEDDALVTRRVIAKMKRENVDVLKAKTVHSIKDALEIYSNIDLLLGMRMHSNILAAVQGTPFVAISYEHKTDGIAKQLDMEKYCISCEEVDNEKLYSLLIDAYKNKVDLKNKLTSSVNAIKASEAKKWDKLLTKN